MKKKYIKPLLEIIPIESENILNSSLGCGCLPPPHWFGPPCHCPPGRCCCHNHPRKTSSIYLEEDSL